MTPAAFIAKWKRAELSERAASQEHFLDLCKLLGVKTPAELDPVGDTFTFEKGVAVAGPASAGSGGQRGFADVWYKGRFGWEYKRKGKYATLTDALRQLQQYRDALANPPLLVVCDIAHTEIHTNFTGYRSDVYTIELERLHEPEQLALLRRVFTDPESFKPEETTEQVTEQAAKNIGAIAQGLRERGHDPHDAAHFLMKVMFCLFAEDVELLPKGVFQTILERADKDPARLRKQMDTLFAAMRTGGDFGVDEIAYFNGGLFDDASAIELTETEIKYLIKAAEKDWGSVEPSVFGTLFERSLDPDKRAQIGAHYTSREDIMLVIEPVIVRPLRKAYEEMQEAVEAQLERRRSATTAATKKKADDAIAELLRGYQDRLASVRVLDPACGSGNFLYVAIQQLLELEKELILYASRPELGTGGLIPRVRPTQLSGIEINPYAAELAQVVIWIGYLQWMHANGFNAPRNPILEPITTIENRDAILKWTTPEGEPRSVWEEGATCAGQADWPEADFIVGNPPFLGSKVFRQNGLNDQYISEMYQHFDLPNTSDLVCYWFEIAQQRIKQTPQLRAGLLATQGIRGRDNRKPLEHHLAHGLIFDAWSDREWILDGAAVHVSIVCLTGPTNEIVFLDGSCVSAIQVDLSAGVAISTTQSLPENGPPLWSVGTQKGGSFDFEAELCERLLSQPTVNGHSPLDVVRPWKSGIDLTRRERGKWNVYFDPDKDREWAAGYDRAFEYAEKHVKPERESNRRESYRIYWWIHQEPRRGLDARLIQLPRFIATPMVTKHRLFAFMTSPTIPDKQLTVFARSDDYFFGVLHSSIHELWARRQGTQLREAESGFRYTPTTCFETFPLPWPPGSEPKEGEDGFALHEAIADTAHKLNEQRENWLNPPAWVAEVAAQVDAEDDFADVAAVSGEEARRLIRQSAIDAASAKHAKLKKRTLTNLYNERPTWLRLAHRALDEAVLAAYAHTDQAGGWDTSWAEVFEETGAGQPLPDGHALSERRAEVEQLILAALLRLNHERAGVS
ncbi:MAG: class I SAM-dependent DNA methyltransferase [Phycisphaera sp.]|nr:class I SAM-dependent DNA methyltransferase [Phycisphaera sp.]